MPELPEVERGRRIAESVALGRRITTIWAARDAIVFEGVAPQRIRRALQGARVDAVVKLLRDRYWKNGDIALYRTKPHLLQVVHPMADKSIALQRIARGSRRS